MIEIKRGSGHCSVKAEGGLVEVASDILNIISDIHGSLMKAGPIEAALFKAMITEGVNNPDCPTWELPQRKDGIEIVIPSTPKKGGEQDG